ncbi:MAG: sialate O-acetylesterase [Gemmataceae bacterium]
MRRALGAAACGLILATAARAEHFEVFVVAGQSNADGRGAAAALTGPLAKWARPQDDVRIAYSCSSLRGPVLASDGFQPLRPGWSVAPGKARPTGLPSNTFGPEVSFGHGLADRLKGKSVRLIKFAEGGTSLAKNWNPDEKAGLYQPFLDFTRKSLKALTAGGDTATVRGMIWHQGESDAELPAAEYEQRLTAFIVHVRADFGVPGMPFGVGEVIDNGKRDAVRAAQKATATKVTGAFLVTVEGLTSSDGGTHFDAASQVALGERFAAGMARALDAK